jgi:two-component system, OmpR family, response regulator MprA
VLDGLRILAVEDDPPTAEVVRSVLEGEGHEVRVAADGRKALAELAGWQPDVVILDLMLPALSGHELLRYLRELPEYRQVPVLVMSGALPTLAKLDGATTVLAKPFELAQLITMIGGLRATLASRSVLSTDN